MIQFGNGVIEAEFQVPTAPFGGACQPSWRPATVLVSCWAHSTVPQALLPGPVRLSLWA